MPPKLTLTIRKTAASSARPGSRLPSCSVSRSLAGDIGATSSSDTIEFSPHADRALSDGSDDEYRPSPRPGKGKRKHLPAPSAADHVAKKSRTAREEGSPAFKRESSSSSGVEMLERQTLDAARTVWGRPLLIDLVHGRHQVDPYHTEVKRNQPDEDDDRLFVCTSPTHSQWVEAKFRHPDNPKTFNKERFATRIDYIGKLRFTEAQRPKKIPRYLEKQFSRLEDTITAEVEPRKDYNPSPFARFFEARKYTAEEASRMKLEERVFLETANGLHITDEVTKEAIPPTIENGFAGMPWATANLRTKAQKALHEKLYLGFAEDNSVKGVRGVVLSPGGNGCTPQFANDAITWNEELRQFIDNPAAENLQNHRFRMTLTDTLNPSAQPDHREFVATGILKAEPGEGRYRYGKSSGVRSELAKELPRQLARYQASHAVKQESVSPSTGHSLPAYHMDAPMELLEPSAARKSSDNEVHSSFRLSPRHTPSVTSLIPESLAERSPTSGTRPINDSSGEELSSVPSDFETFYGGETESDVEKIKKRSKAKGKWKVSAVGFLRAHRESFDRAFEAGGSNQVVEYFKNPLITKNVAFKFASVNGIRMTTANSLLRERRGSFDREYQAGGPKQVISYFNNPIVTENAAKHFASENSTQMTTANSLFRERRGSFDREYQAGGPKRVIEYFQDPIVTHGAASQFASTNGIHMTTANSLFRERRGSFDREYQAGGPKQVAHHFANPIVTENAAKRFAQGKGIQMTTASSLFRKRRNSFDREYQAGGPKQVVSYFNNPIVTRRAASQFASKNGTQMMGHRII